MTPSRVLRTVGIGVGIALAQVACTSEVALPSPRATVLPSQPAQTPSAECIKPVTDLLTLINQTDPVACYGDDPLTVDALVSGVGAIDCAPIQPRWFGCEAWVQLQPIPAQRSATGIVLAATSGPSDVPWMFAAIHPETALDASQIMGRSLRITGHYDDPAAQTCRQTGPVFDEETPPPPEQVIPDCQRLFVMTGFEEL